MLQQRSKKIYGPRIRFEHPERLLLTDKEPKNDNLYKWYPAEVHY